MLFFWTVYSPNQHIRMISEGSCDIDRSNDFWNYNIVMAWINDILKEWKYIHVCEYITIFHNITDFALIK